MSHTLKFVEVCSHRRHRHRHHHHHHPLRDFRFSDSLLVLCNECCPTLHILLGSCSLCEFLFPRFVIHNSRITTQRQDNRCRQRRIFFKGATKCEHERTIRTGLTSLWSILSEYIPSCIMFDILPFFSITYHSSEHHSFDFFVYTFQHLLTVCS